MPKALHELKGLSRVDPESWGIGVFDAFVKILYLFLVFIKYLTSLSFINSVSLNISLLRT